MRGRVLIIVFAAIAAFGILYGQKGTSSSSDFQDWKGKYGVVYSSQFENAYRERVFIENLAKIKLHNAQRDRTYEMGLNQFSALTQRQFAQTYLTLQPPKDIKIQPEQKYELLGDIDWNDHGAVTPVKNQGQCGSCWAFSATGAFEGLYKLVHGQLLSFSESQLVDCSGGYGNMGCKGGEQQNAYEYISENGITTTDQYPYVPVQNSCKMKGGPYKLSNYIVVANCNYLTNAISARPVAVSVDATNWSPYKSGVFNNCKTSINHGVTLVGVKGGNWVVKNSWGTGWGDQGYITLASGNTCAICSQASYPLR